MKTWLFTMFIASLMVALFPTATIRYVAPGGLDSGNDCTAQASPCATIQHAVDVSSAGDEIRVALTNTLVASQAVGIRVAGGGNYHIGSTSAARDVGVDAGVTNDMDGSPRPMGRGYDLGADEAWVESQVYLPAVWYAYPYEPVVPTIVRFDPATPTLAVGQVIAVNVWVDDVTNLAGVELHMSYTPAILEVQDANPSLDGVQIAAGSFLKPDFVVQNQADPTQGRIDFAVLQLPPSLPVSGSGALATITFKAKAAGASPLTFNIVNLAGGQGTVIPAVLQNGQVTVTAN